MFFFFNITPEFDFVYTTKQKTIKLKLDSLLQEIKCSGGRLSDV